MKFALLVVVCVFGTVLCRSHEQQYEYAESLVDHMEDVSKQIKEILEKMDLDSEHGKKIMFMHANMLNFDVHFVLDCLQHVITKYEWQPPALQEIVYDLNNISFKLEKSLVEGVEAVQTQFWTSIANMVKEAKNIKILVHQSGDLSYAETVLRFLDDLVSATEKVILRDAIYGRHKFIVKTYIRTSGRVLSLFLSTIRSENTNVYNDIVRYSSKLSSSITETSNLMKEFMFMYNTTKPDEFKEIVYSLGKLSQDNEEVLYNEKDLKKIKKQFQVTIVNLSEQLTKVVDAGYSADGKSVEDDNMIYIVLPEIVSQAMKLARNLHRTVDDYLSHE